jgi:holin-like protein
MQGRSGKRGRPLSTIFLLIVLQLIGESIVQVSGVPVPGAIIGLILLYAILAFKGGVSDEMSRTSGFLLQNLGVLFVPAGVGVIAYLPMIADQWWIILLVLLISVCMTIGITALIVAKFSPRSVDALEAAAE